jgi:hypothetical protein
MNLPTLFSSSIAVIMFPLIAIAAGVGDLFESEKSDHARCLPQPRMAAYLKQAWNEVPVAYGDLNDGGTVTMYRSPNGSWTLIDHRSSGYDCVVASGTRMNVEASPIKHPPSSS